MTYNNDFILTYLITEHKIAGGGPQLRPTLRLPGEGLMILFWGFPMVRPYCFPRGGAMQMRRRGLLLAPPLPRLAFPRMPRLCPTRSQLLPLTRNLSSAAPRCPHPLCNLKGNKYKLYKVKGGPTLPWGGAAGRRQGHRAGQALVRGCGQLTSFLAAAACWHRPWA